MDFPKSSYKNERDFLFFTRRLGQAHSTRCGEVTHSAAEGAELKGKTVLNRRDQHILELTGTLYQQELYHSLETMEGENVF